MRSQPAKPGSRWLLHSEAAFGIALPLPACNRRQFGCGCSSVVEHDLAKVGVEGSSPFARSKNFHPSNKFGPGSPFGGLGKGKAAQVVRSLGGPAACREERAIVGLQKLNPVGDVARVPDVTIKTKFCTQECGAQLGNQFLRCVLA